jgi:hypothetical protein
MGRISGRARRVVIREVDIDVAGEGFGVGLVDVEGCFASRDGWVRVGFCELGGLEAVVGMSFLEGMLI